MSDVDSWNKWRQENPNIDPDFRDEIFGDMWLEGYDLRNADFYA